MDIAIIAKRKFINIINLFFLDILSSKEICSLKYLIIKYTKNTNNWIHKATNILYKGINTIEQVSKLNEDMHTFIKIDSQSIFENVIAWSNREFKKM